jgi:hypothetical protein
LEGFTQAKAQGQSALSALRLEHAEIDGQDFETRLSALKLASEQAKAVDAAAPDYEGVVNNALT